MGMNHVLPAGCWLGAAAIVAAMAGDPAWAADGPERASVVAVRASQTCLTEDVRITGFAVAREERGVNIDIPGYRVTDVLVAEGDRVAAKQELLRAHRVGTGDPSQAGQPATAAAGPGLPDNLSLFAPFAGIVTRVNALVGSVTGAAALPISPTMPPQPQIGIAADSGIDLLVDVPSLYATQIRKGSVARILRAGDSDVAGTVRVAVGAINPASQLGQARVAVEPPTALRPGQFASAVLETARSCGVTVPLGALTYQNGTATVQVLRGTIVEARNVVPGLSSGTLIQIREGLTEGEAVVASVGASLKSGDQVNPLFPDEADGEKP